MPDASKVEFLRFGSSIPGAYWGCCAADVIQCFSGDPDAKASIQMVDGDGGSPCINGAGKQMFAGPTNRDVFLARIRVGTFGVRDMPNHAFFAILTNHQIGTANGKKWLAILKECGFEFLRTVCNSVYAGGSLAPLSSTGGSSQNHIFVLIRNIGSGNIADPYTPPKAWTDLSLVVPEMWNYLSVPPKSLSEMSHAKQTECWNKIGPAKFVTEEELEAAGAPVILAAKRDYTRQQEKSQRKEKAKPTASLKGCNAQTVA